MASIDIPFGIGQQVYWVERSGRSEDVQCPECCGTAVVTITLGNGEQYEVDCRRCGRGYGDSTGRIQKSVREFPIRRVTLTDVEIRSVDEYRYASALFAYVDSKDLFEHESDAHSHRDTLVAQWAEERDRIHLNNIMQSRKDMAWSVHYWRRQRREKVKEIESIDKRLREIKERAATESK